MKAGAKSTDLCRRHAISEQTFYAPRRSISATSRRRLPTRRSSAPPSI